MQSSRGTPLRAALAAEASQHFVRKKKSKPYVMNIKCLVGIITGMREGQVSEIAGARGEVT